MADGFFGLRCLSALLAAFAVLAVCAPAALADLPPVTVPPEADAESPGSQTPQQGAGGAAGSVRVYVPPESQRNCAGDVAVVVASDAAAQSDIYSAVTLAGVLGTDCVVLAGARGGSMPAAQRERLEAAAVGGYVVGGLGAVPAGKVAGLGLSRLAGSNRWDTARLVGAEAFVLAGGDGAESERRVAASAGAQDPGRDCAGDVAVVVASDAAAQSDLYSAVTLAGVLGTDCVVLAGARGGSMPAAQRERLEAAAVGGYVVGGLGAVPAGKVAGLGLSRLAGSNRWDTARLVGELARELAAVPHERPDPGSESDEDSEEFESGKDGGPTAEETRRAEREMLRQINELRVERGLSALDANENLTQQARDWSAVMRERGRRDPDPFYTSRYPSGWSAAGQNVAHEKSDAALIEKVSDVMQRMIDSPASLREIIGSEFDSVGVGIVVDGDEMWATQYFGDLCWFPNGLCDITHADIRSAEREMHRQLNELRTGLGLEPYKLSENLSLVARTWAETLRDREIHPPEHNPDFQDWYPPGWTIAGENLAWFFNLDSLLDKVDSAMQGLIDSPGHYRNLVHETFNEVGIGIAVRGRDFWVIQNFARCSALCTTGSVNIPPAGSRGIGDSDGESGEDSEEPVPGQEAAPTVAEIRDAGLEMLRQINVLRAERGLAPYAHNDNLALVAHTWADALRLRGSNLLHNPDYGDWYPPGWTLAGENLAWALSVSPLQAKVDLLLRELMGSPGHHANLMHAEFNEVGIGIVVQGDAIWIVQNFARCSALCTTGSVNIPR
ncbi:CAP domain-containing protein [Candidatus Poriferisodalis sp.]|uniref:CAP domain-containing protein n=1 Tax=Candidatus Poriferisodalis sp. TaxID=3101277 RepID=UPI003B01E34C